MINMKNELWKPETNLIVPGNVDARGKQANLDKLELKTLTEELRERQQEIFDKKDRLELIPNGIYVLISPSINPYVKLVSDNGLILPNEEEAMKHFSRETGQMENNDKAIGFGRVLEVGPDVKYINNNDEVWYAFYGVIPIKYFGEVYHLIPSTGIYAIVNENLKSRINSNKYNDLCCNSKNCK